MEPIYTNLLPSTVEKPIFAHNWMQAHTTNAYIWNDPALIV